MRFPTIIMFALASRLVPLAIAKPVPNWKAGGFAIPLSRHSSILDSNKSIDLNAITSHGISVREKIIGGLDNYETNTGTTHPFAVKRNNSKSDSGLRKRGAGLSLTTYQSVFWIGEVSIGAPPKTLNVRVDTGSADMWVLQSGCRGISPGRELWDPDSSEHAKNQNQPFVLQYSDGAIVKGQLYTDTVTIAGLTVPADPDQTFGSATLYISHSQSNGYADGLLGLAFPSVSNFGVSPLLQSLATQNRPINPTFSLKLSSAGAEMYVGGANSRLYNGDITYVPVTVPGFWQVSMDDVRAHGNKILEDVPVIFDTGSTYIFGDSERVSELYESFGGTRVQDSDTFDVYYLPCDSFPTVGLTFGGKTFEIPPGTLRLHPIVEGSTNCFSAIIGDPDAFEFWEIGTTFLQGAYSVFDYSASKVGFAQLA